jgi:hypothetical protein
MKKLLLASVAVLALSIPVQAQHHHHHRHHGGGGGGNWAGPLVGGLIIGGLVAGALSQPRYSSPSTIYTDPYPPPYQPVCSRRFIGYDYYGNPIYRTYCE